MKVENIIAIAMIMLCLNGCGVNEVPQTEVVEPVKEAESTEEILPQSDYIQISAEEAKKMMEEVTDSLVIDVREQDEYDAGHIPGAVLLPVGAIDEASAAAVIPNKDTVVLVYCRSGNRSKTASSALVELGYSSVYEFGGIIDWPYEIEQ